MIFEMIREGGPFAYLAVALGLLGLVLGGVSLVSLLGKSRAAFALGVVTLVVAMAAAGAGMVGTVWGRAQVTNAVGFVDSDVDRERIMRAGFRESQSAAWIGLFAALVPLVLGAAAAIGGSRVQPPKTRAQVFAEPMVSADEGLGGQTAIAFIFTAIGVIACGGAWAMAHAELPKERYGFDEHDSESWALAYALEGVDKKRMNACRELSRALDSFWGATDRREWPRTMRATIAPELAAWRQAADTCTRKTIEAFGDPAGDELPQRELLESALLQDDALRAQVLAWKPRGAPEEGAAGEDADSDSDEAAPPPGALGILGGAPRETTAVAGSLDRSVIAAVIKRHIGAIRLCYETALTKSPTLEGKVMVDFVIGQDGHVVSVAEASGSTLSNKQVTVCVLKQFKAMDFPKPDGGGVVKVKYPIIFKAAQ